MGAYWKLQLLNRWRAIDPRNSRREGKSAARWVFGVIGFVALALYLYGVIVFLEMLLFDQFEQLGQASAVWLVALMGSTAVTLVYGFFSLSGQLFFAKDTAYVAALPISSRGALAVKASLVALGEMGLTVLLCAPLVIRMGISAGAGAWFYAKALLACLFVPLLPLGVALCLSFLLIRLSALWKRREGVTTVVSFAFAIGAMMISMVSQQVNQEELQRLALSLMLGRGSLADFVVRRYPPLGWVNDAVLTGGPESLGKLLGFMALSAAAFALAVWLLGKGYLGLASRQEEALRRVNRGKSAKVGRDEAHSPFAALLWRELKEVLTVPVYATNCLMGVVMYPLMMVIILVSLKSQPETATLVQGLGGMIPKDWFFACALGLLCLTNGMGMAVSTAVSREGKRHDMRKTYPVPGKTFLWAKLCMGMLLNLAAHLTTCGVLWAVLPGFWLETLGALLLCQLFSFLWCALALILDVYRPKLAWRSETEAVKQNMNGFLSMLLCVGLLAALVGACWLCVRLGGSLTAGVGLAVALMALGCLISAKWLTGKASATYFLR